MTEPIPASEPSPDLNQTQKLVSKEEEMELHNQ